VQVSEPKLLLHRESHWLADSLNKRTNNFLSKSSYCTYSWRNHFCDNAKVE